MGKVYYITKNVGLGMLVLAASALATIIALSIAYNKEKAKNQGMPGDGAPDSTSMPPVSTAPFNLKEPWDHYRLPDSLVPVYYNVTLWPRLEPNTDGLYIFIGYSTVVFRCVRETDLIIIHSRKLNLTDFQGHHAKLSGLDEVDAPAILKSWLVLKTEYLVLQLHSRLALGATYVLHTEFRGELADDLEGFYRSEYIEDGVKKIVATSQMQATYARKTFPCFDEPAMKAVFNVIIIHNRDTVALSNGREIDAEDSVIDDIPVRVTTFESTERMSTYLLAFIVSDFVSIQSNQSKNMLIRIWARKKAMDDRHGDYALNITGPILQFYELYYNTKYPLAKSDQIALPDFNAGAMENWGLVTYRETALLYDPIISSTRNKERVTTVISHELAHMWFGNLVTLRWWNDLWLNEGFASYVEYLGADHAEPSWNMKDMIILYDVHKVFAVDALASSRPLSCREEEVNEPAQISEMFNTISYSKGAAVLRMLSEFLTEPVFARGLSSYLKTYAFSNTVYTDLWDHLQQAVENTSGIHIPRTVHDIMNSWVLQMGFPVVTIDTRTGSITQKHFLLDPDSVVDRPSQFNYTWFVPIKWMKTGVDQPQYWLLQKTDTNSLMRVSGEDWVLANTNVSGYFRVNYDLDNWDRLLSLLNNNHQALSIINRAQIIDDAFNLARAKIISTTLALTATKYLSKERDYIPWESALRNFDYYILMFDRTGVFGALQAYLKKQIQPLFEHFKTITANWTKVPTGHTDQYNQINAIEVACTMGVEGCRELIKSWYRQWMENPSHNPIHSNLKSTVYCRAIAFGGVKEWDFAWTVFKNATLASEASRLRSAMACTKTPWLLNRYLEYTLDPTKIRKQDATSTIQSIARNVVGMPLAWNFIRAKWTYIFHQYGRGSFSFSNLVNEITKRFSTEFELQELKKFKEENLHAGFGSATLALEQAIEKTTANIKWVAENKDPVLRWFTEEST
ncbi:aminopeptidase N-like [Xiphias gladius]|uniref:aminopeptidase N-like n=1 Tax=Xiphias gladius TaxID=8245 RepID=UPI001A99541E|nr:aminopeptidase N-like [Xiphias gladius]XP_039979944.1 aminopeptidase N-like [Xiphias gladius]XP_039979954.1 aminopeptidase N-like [Xiphias gladius]XP_039979962.1 aminopeptidase N-like [Xiphias gladius]